MHALSFFMGKLIYWLITTLPWAVTKERDMDVGKRIEYGSLDFGDKWDMVPRSLLLNGGAKAGARRADGRGPRGKEVRQMNSEENRLGYPSTVACELSVCVNHLGTRRFRVSGSECRGSVCLTSSWQVQQMLVHGPYFEQQGLRRQHERVTWWVIVKGKDTIFKY